MADRLDMEIQSRPGRVVLRFTRGDQTTEYPLSADGATQLADRISTAAERARDLD